MLIEDMVGRRSSFPMAREFDGAGFCEEDDSFRSDAPVTYLYSSSSGQSLGPYSGIVPRTRCRIRTLACGWIRNAGTAQFCKASSCI